LSKESIKIHSFNDIILIHHFSLINLKSELWTSVSNNSKKSSIFLVNNSQFVSYNLALVSNSEENNISFSQTFLENEGSQ